MLKGVKNPQALVMEATVLPNVSKCRKTAVPKHQFRSQSKTASKCPGRSVSRLRCKCLTKNAPKFQSKTAHRYQNKKQFKSPSRIATKFPRSTAKAFPLKQPSFRLGKFPRRSAVMVAAAEVAVMENKKKEKLLCERFCAETKIFSKK